MKSRPGRSESGARARVAAGVFLTSLVVVLALVEVASRRLLPNRYFVWPPNFTATFDAGDVIRHGVAFPGTLTINSDGFRGDAVRDSHTVRILAIGGSTTICVYLDDAKAWPRLLQDHLNEALGDERVWVGNAGRPGHSTDEHTLQVEKLLAQEKGIDALVMLVGVNDFLRYLPRAKNPRESSAWSALDARVRTSRAFSFYPGWDEETPWYLRNFVTRISRLLSWHPIPIRAEDGIRPMGKKGEWVAFLRRYRTRASELVLTLPNLQPGIAQYIENLNRIVEIAEENEVRVIFVTQPVLWRAGLSSAERELLWAGGPPWNRMKYGDVYFSAEALARGMASYNEGLLRVCQATGAECVDAARQTARTAEVFYDDAHFTEAGSAELAEILSKAVSELGGILDSP